MVSLGSRILSQDPIPQLPPVNEGEKGAILDFYGVVRGVENGRAIHGIAYSTYLPMAEKELDRLITEAGVRYPDCAVFIQHRLGFVAAGQASVIIRTQAKHSLQAFEANQWILFALKKTVPIWKEIVSEESG